ncbi:MAG: hypothetical protein GWO24_27555, partial [Akkermansiaceae bacterium]|nr:hypothetical protein [Akkermansiaceae bacterium]
MKKSELEHVIRAAGSITGSREIYIIGSQAILASVTSGPEVLFASREADVFVDQRPELSDLIDGSIGELSPFDQTFGYYAHGVGEETATLPAGWRDRVIRLENDNTGGTAGLCLEVHDLLASKLVAGREKDAEFVAALLGTDLVDAATLRRRVEGLPIDREARLEVIAR